MKSCTEMNNKELMVVNGGEKNAWVFFITSIRNYFNLKK